MASPPTGSDPMAASRQVAQQDRPSAIQARALIAELETKARKSEDPLDLATVLCEEYAALTGDDARSLGDDLSTVIEEIHGRHHAALCLSGGGIRSATFNLGMLQALAKRDLLQRFH